LMNQNGIAFSYCDPDHSSVTNTATIQSFGNIETCRRIPITGSTMVQGGGDSQNWLCTVTDNGPVVPAEMQFSNTPAVQATPYMVIAVVGTAGDLFEWEVAMHAEWQGPTTPSMTPSHVDATSWPVVDDELKQGFNHGPPQPKEEKGILSRMISSLSEHLPRVIGAVGKGMAGLPAIISGLTNLIPMTGGNPMIANQGFSYPMLMHDKKRIVTGHGRGSNLYDADLTSFQREFSQLCVMNSITPQDLFASLNLKIDLGPKDETDLKSSFHEWKMAQMLKPKPMPELSMFEYEMVNHPIFDIQKFEVREVPIPVSRPSSTELSPRQAAAFDYLRKKMEVNASLSPMPPPTAKLELPGLRTVSSGRSEFKPSFDTPQ